MQSQEGRRRRRGAFYREVTHMINLNRILHPTDFSDYSEPALKYACAFAEQFDAELHLIHVTPELAAVMPRPMGGYLPPGYPEEMKQRSDAALADLPDKAWCEGRKVVRVTVEGPAFLEIIRYAHDQNMDLIVMGTHGRAGLSHALMGSVAERVVRKAPCPVLTVHPSDHQFVMP